MAFEQIKRLGAAAVAALAATVAAQAQQQPLQPQPPVANSAPQRTTASYEDWTVRCETRGTPPVKSCEMVQAVTAQGQAAPVT